MIGVIVRAGAGVLKGAVRRGVRGGRGRGRGGRRSSGGANITIHLDMDRLEDLIDSVGPDAEAAVEESAQAIRGAAMTAAPVDTGSLRASHTVQQTGNASYKIGPTVDYGIFVELGTRRRAARPFLRPAFDREAAQLKQRLAAIFR